MWQRSKPIVWLLLWLLLAIFLTYLVLSLGR